MLIKNLTKTYEGPFPPSPNPNRNADLFDLPLSWKFFAVRITWKHHHLLLAHAKMTSW